MKQVLLFVLLTIFSCNQAKASKFIKIPPQAKTFPKSLIKKLSKKYKHDKFKNIRTRHLNQSGKPLYTNRLYLESSPYLLQHSHNPVNWYPWGKEAFETAKKLNLPILLSVGYSTCHWCHVMEEESFENLKISKYFNQNYIAIKVDREERPDIDAVYMKVVQAINGSGGWPMTLWLTPDLQPIYGTTYLPANDGDRGKSLGFLSMLKRFKTLYIKNPEKLKKSAYEIVNFLKKNNNQEISEKFSITDVPIKTAINQYMSSFDNDNGGIIGRMKFPSSFPTRLMISQYKKSKNKKILTSIIKTLDNMAAGGIHDHLAGGFHRYSTDPNWLIPHFEKMLYDNALLAMDYTQAYQITKFNRYKVIAKEILDYVLMEMTNSNGVFYSAIDADSMGPLGKRDEGYFYTWTISELKMYLNNEESNFVQDYFNIKKKGNFEKDRSVLHYSRAIKKNESKLLASSKLKLLKARSLRPLPFRDEKIITAWNGLMIKAFAQAAFVFNDKEYLDVAEKASSFFVNHFNKFNELHRIFLKDKFNTSGFSDDYAFLISGLIELYQSSGDVKWIKNAIKLDSVLAGNFEDKKDGGVFRKHSEHKKIILKEKPIYDGATPSTNSIYTLNLLKLYEYTAKKEYIERALKSFKTFSGNINKSPRSVSEMLMAIDFYISKPKELVVVFKNEKDLFNNQITKKIGMIYNPNLVISLIHEGDNKLSIHENKTTINGKTTFYLCQNGSCRLPTIDLEKLVKLIEL